MYTTVLIVLAFLTSLKTASAGNCTTPKGTEGNCIPILSCRILVEALATLDENHFKFVKQHECGYDKLALVCCPSIDIPTQTKKNNRLVNNSKKKVADLPTQTKKDNRLVNNSTKKVADLLASKSYCGYQHTDDYFVDKNREDSNIDEFPWLGAVMYLDENNDRVAYCTCTLINDKYCITAAHCAVLSGHRKLVSVLLGDYTLSNEKDCVTNGQLEECNDPVAEYKVVEIVIHNNFSRRPLLNDIALLRLNQSVGYSDFIRPICLPLQDVKPPKAGDIYYATGWGSRMVAEDKMISVKQRIKTQLLLNKDCMNLISRVATVNNITNQQLCTKGIITEDCQGNSGGPLMFSYRNQWYLKGIDSYGTACGINTPSINTNVVSYLDWIVQNVKA